MMQLICNVSNNVTYFVRDDRLKNLFSPGCSRHEFDPIFLVRNFQARLPDLLDQRFPVEVLCRFLIAAVNTS